MCKCKCEMIVKKSYGFFYKLPAKKYYSINLPLQKFCFRNEVI